MLETFCFDFRPKYAPLKKDIRRITCLVVFAVLMGAADDTGDVHALPLEVDGLRGLLVPLEQSIHDVRTKGGG